MTIQVRTVRHAGLVVPDAQDAVDFYEEVWGLRVVDDKNGAAYLRGSSPEHHLLAVYPGQQAGVHHVSLSLDGMAAIDAAAEALEAEGVHIEEEPHAIDEPGGGYGLRFRDPDGRLVELSAEAEQLPAGAWNAAVVPYKVSHTVLNTPDIDRAVDFYTRMLGFRVSDWNGHWMAFLRCNTDHHSIAFAAAPHVALNHIAYEVPSNEDIFRGIENFQRQRRAQTPIWGPGRHGPGNNLFAYFEDPAGLVCEYTAEVEQITDESKWVCRVWERSGENPGGPPPPEARRAMEGTPDPYARAS
jgi:catechol 2,3-dioxygenase-like lactoylglutathione lyase family enzyme